MSVQDNLCRRIVRSVVDAERRLMLDDTITLRNMGTPTGVLRYNTN